RVKLADFSLTTRSARDLVPEQVARRYHILPVDSSDSHLEIATANPFDLDCEKTLAFATGREVRVLLASPAVIQEKIDQLYRAENVLDKLLEGMETDTDITTLDVEEEDDIDEAMIAEAEASQRPVVRMVDLIISEGILARASDLHIEPEEGGVSVRYRIDGVLRQVMKIPRAAGLPLISRLKIIANLDIADRLRPQDGRARVVLNKRPVDLRISTLPASQGEKVVIRILDASRTVLALESLGLAKTESSAIEELLEHRDGVILVTGPTGSGKTTTLYSAIRFVQDEGVNIVTVEDPVEYRLSGIVQVQVHEKAGLTFSAALRSILRQDPDVVLVGEIRDNETAQIAIQASLTGHLVLSTLHTNDAASAVTRLADLGVEHFKIAPALRGIVAQRLMRTLCSTCREELNDPVSATLQKWIPAGTQLHRAVGCPDCAMTGYRGRFSIMEVLKVTKEIERIISDGGTANRIAEAAARGGMKNLWDSGLTHVLNGESTMDELLRVVDMPQEEIPDAAADGASVAVATAPAPAAVAEARAR
ncbi:MAG: GspE/PulE family protein, partial [Myxococcota bacterium]